MGLENILEKIRLAGELEVEKIRLEAQKQVAMIAEKTSKDIIQMKKDFEASVTGEIHELENQMLSGARGDIQRNRLNVKRGLIEEVFQEARKQAVSYSDETYAAYLEKILVSLGVFGEYTLILNLRDSKRVAERLIRTAKEKTGGKLLLKLSKSSREIAGGFILQGCRMEINASLEASFAQLQRSMEQEVSHLLFGVEDR